MELKNKVIVITGASKGLGKNLSQAFVAHGATVVMSGREQVSLEAAATAMEATAIAADVTKPEQVSNVAAEVIKKFGRIDIWINNAGIWFAHEPIEEIDWRRAHELFEVNFFGLVYGSQEAMLQMRKQGGGTIVNILSSSALDGRPLSSAYCASKFAADGFTKTLRYETEHDSITVIGVYPGGIKTELFHSNVPQDYDAYMEPHDVVSKIIGNLLQEKPELSLVIRRPG